MQSYRVVIVSSSPSRLVTIDTQESTKRRTEQGGEFNSATRHEDTT